MEEKDGISETRIGAIGQSVAWAAMEIGLVTAAAIEEGVGIVGETM